MGKSCVAASRSRLRCYGATVIAFFLAAQADAAPPFPKMALVCRGQIVRAVPIEQSSAVAVDDAGHSVRASGVTERAMASDADVLFRMEDGAATLHLPSSLLPGFHNGKAGWMPVENLQVSDREIAGKVRINFLVHSSFRIDRMTGQMTSSGGFDGACEKIDMEHQ